MLNIMSKRSNVQFIFNNKNVLLYNLYKFNLFRDWLELRRFYRGIIHFSKVI